MNANINFNKDKNRIKIVLELFLFLFLIPSQTNATSGACSWHGGVSCSAGSDWDGSVVCFDGWKDSSVSYSSTCSKGADTCPMYLPQESFNMLTNDIDDLIAKTKAQSESTCYYTLSNAEKITEQYYQICLKENQSLSLIGSRSGRNQSDINLKDCEMERSINLEKNYADKKSCLNKDNITILQYEIKKSCLRLDTTDYCSILTPNSYTSGNQCACNNGYKFNSTKTQCIKEVVCKDITNGYLGSDNKCHCNIGHLLNDDGFCKKKEPISVSTPKSNINQTQTNEVSAINSIPNKIVFDQALASKLKGNILLQVEDHGKAWYVNPADSKRYYMQDGDAAYQIMRSAGLGIGDTDLKKIPSVNSSGELKMSKSVCAVNTLANKLKGKILLQVNQHGEAWYVSPDKCRRIYLKDGSEAYSVMRYLGLGITNKDLEGIQKAQ